MTLYRRPESVLVVVHAPDKQCLLMERADHAGYWQSVTGALEEAETILDCARRELFEETGIRAEPVPTGVVNTFVLHPHWRHRYAPQVKENTETVFSVLLEQIVDPLLNPQEHTQFVWLDAESAMQRCFSHTNVDAIKQIVLNQLD